MGVSVLRNGKVALWHDNFVKCSANPCIVKLWKPGSDAFVFHEISPDRAARIELLLQSFLTFRLAFPPPVRY